MISSPTDQNTESTPEQPADVQCTPLPEYHRILKIYINLVGADAPAARRFYEAKYKIKS